MKNRTYVGLDVHAKSISMAVILPDGELLEEKIAWLETLNSRLTSN